MGDLEKTPKYLHNSFIFRRIGHFAANFNKSELWNGFSYSDGCIHQHLNQPNLRRRQGEGIYHNGSGSQIKYKGARMSTVVSR